MLIFGLLCLTYTLIVAAAIGFFFPVVPKGQARIRVQLSAAHEKEHLDKAIAAFTKVGKKHGILGLMKDQIIAKFGM